MPIETRTVLTCGECGADKAEANGWYLVTVACLTIGDEGSTAARRPRVIVEHADEYYLEAMVHIGGLPSEGTDAACGRGCVIKMVSKALANLPHEAPKRKSSWKRDRRQESHDKRQS
jgi:hypothetical protein